MERIYRKNYVCFIPIIILLLTVESIFLSTICISTDKKAFSAGLSAYSVIRTDTMEVLISENGDARLPMASTTKIMTALIAIENCDLDEEIVIDDRSVGVEGSSVYLKTGEKLTLKDLLYCMMLRSGNDSATAIALHIANTIEDFADIMNIRADSMGLKNTHFVNPHGLHDDDHYTSANDLAVISAIAMNNRIFKEIVSTKCITIGKDESRRTLTNKNKMLKKFYGANGVKTGYTKKSGRCLVSSAERNGVDLVCVVLNYGDTYGISSTLLDKGFSLL